MSIRSLKLCFNGEIRRFSLESLKVVEGTVSLDDLKTVVRNTFTELKEKEFILSYKDEDEDVITISTDVEVIEAFNVVRCLNANVLRLEVSRVENSKKEENKAVHFRIICDGCNANPIIGDRFKCSVRDDYDLCAKCDALDTSPHPFLKIKTPAQSPAAIMTILKPHQEGPSQEQWGDQSESTSETESKCSAGKPGVKPAGGCSLPGLVRLECLSALREFGPYYATRKPNNCLVLIDPNNIRDDAKPWKFGKCLRLAKGGGNVEMDGNGGGWASFHVLPVADAGPAVVRLVSSNRKQCLAAANGYLVSISCNEVGINTHFRLHEGSDDDQLDPEWHPWHPECMWDLPIKEATTGWDSHLEDKPKETDKAAAEPGSCENPTPSTGCLPIAVPPATKEQPVEEEPFWKGMSNSLIEDVKAQMQANETVEQVAVHPPAPPALPQASFVRDISIPDGELITCGTGFVKTWRLRNDSDFAFPSDVKLVHTGGADMGNEREVSVSPPQTFYHSTPVNSKTIHPFEEFEVSVSMVAPNQPGKYASFWRLEVNQERFGHQVWSVINVVESPQVLMRKAQEESEKIALQKLKTKEDEEQEKVLQEVARAQAEEVLAVQAAKEEARLEELRLEARAREQDELALAEAEACERAEVERALAEAEAQAEAENKAREQAEAEARVRERAEARVRERVEARAREQAEVEARQRAEEESRAREQAEAVEMKEAEEAFKATEAERMETERLHELELAAMVDAEEKRIAEVALAEEQLEAQKQEDALEAASGNSIDWEHVDGVIEDASEAASSVNGDSDSFDPYASDLSASVEGAAMAGAALNNSQDLGEPLSESLVAVLENASFEESMGKWGPAVTRLFEMGLIT